LAVDSFLNFFIVQYVVWWLFDNSIVSHHLSSLYL